MELFNAVESWLQSGIGWYNDQPVLIQIFVGYVFIKNIVLRWVSDEIRKYIFTPIGKHMKKMLRREKKAINERKLAVRAHVIEHHPAKLSVCREGMCVVLQPGMTIKYSS